MRVLTYGISSLRLLAWMLAGSVLASCSSLGLTAPDNTYCSGTGQVPTYSIVCTSYSNGYCSATATRSGPLATVCTAYACKDGFTAPTGKAKDGCYAGNELVLKLRSFAGADAELARRVGNQADADSWRPAFSPDGARLAFVTSAVALAGTTFRTANIVIKDLRNGALKRVTVGLQGEPPDGDSEWPQFTPDGNGLIFQSSASNLVEGDTNRQDDIFLADLRSGTISRLSVLRSGAQVNGHSRFPKLSPDGHRLSFLSSSNEWTPTLPGGESCAYVKDLRSGSVVRLPAPGRDLPKCSFSPAFIPGGDALALLGYVNDIEALYLFNTRTGSINPVKMSLHARIGRPTQRLVGDGVVSRDGSKLAFTATLISGKNASNLVYVVGVKSGQGDRLWDWGDSEAPSFSPDGTKVAFGGTNVSLPGTHHVYVKDLRTEATSRVSTSSDGIDGNGRSTWPIFSPDGSSLAFISNATNLVPGDTNGVWDVFVKNLKTGAITRASVPQSPP